MLIFFKLYRYYLVHDLFYNILYISANYLNPTDLPIINFNQQNCQRNSCVLCTYTHRNMLFVQSEIYIKTRELVYISSYIYTLDLRLYYRFFSVLNKQWMHSKFELSIMFSITAQCIYLFYHIITSYIHIYLYIRIQYIMFTKQCVWLIQGKCNLITHNILI